MKSVDPENIEVNENKIAIVLHDRNQCFSNDQITETLSILQNIFFINFRAKSARRYYNFLKKEYTHEPFLNFLYSKKNACICIHSEKI